MICSSIPVSKMINSGNDNGSDYKIVCPISSYNTNMLKLILSNCCNEILSLYPYYSIILLADSNLSTIWYCKNQTLIHGEIKLSPGLSFKEDYIGKTALSESFKSRDISVLHTWQSSCKVIGNFSSCAAPIVFDDDCAFLGVFFLNSKADNISIDFFRMFFKCVQCNLENKVLRNRISDYIKSNMLSMFDINVLTRSEKKILSLIKKGFSNKEISDVLMISENTVKSHVKIIIEKLCCSNRTQAAANAIFCDINGLL